VAHIACLGPRRLDRRFAGRRFDDALLRELPETVDPCGENGEFHTVVTAGPMFSADRGRDRRDGRAGRLVFTDVVPR